MTAISDIQKVIYDWVDDFLNVGKEEEDKLPIVWENPNAPRLIPPFISLKISGIERIGTSYFGDVDEEGKLKIIATNVINTDITCYKEAKSSKIDAVEILEGLRLSLGKESVTQHFYENDMSIVKSGINILFLPEIVATGFEPRATSEFKFGIGTYIIDDVGIIEEIEGTGEVETPDDKITLNYEVK